MFLSPFGCAGWRQIVPPLDDVDAMSGSLALQIDGHNDNGERREC